MKKDKEVLKITIEHVEFPRKLSPILAPAAGISLKEVDWDTRKIQVLRIPANGSASSIIQVKTIVINQNLNFSQDKRNGKETTGMEEWVKHVPDIRQTSEDSVFDWKYRSLVIGEIEENRHPELNGTWCMYKCDEPRVGSPLENLEKNPFFEKSKHARAFGDVYVFRLEDKAPDRPWRRECAKEWRVPPEKRVRPIFKALAICKVKDFVGKDCQ